jgi:hypothetical protein
LLHRESSTFWDDRVVEYMPSVAEVGLPVSSKGCRAALKVMLYTALNGFPLVCTGLYKPGREYSKNSNKKRASIRPD